MGILTKNSDLQVAYDTAKDEFLIVVPFGLEPQHLTNAIAFIRRRTEQKLRGAPAGRKEYFRRGLAALDAGRVRQIIITKGDVDLFKATERSSPDRAFSFPRMTPGGSPT